MVTHAQAITATMIDRDICPPSVCPLPEEGVADREPADNGLTGVDDGPNKWLAGDEPVDAPSMIGTADDTGGPCTPSSLKVSRQRDKIPNSTKLTLCTPHNRTTRVISGHQVSRFAEGTYAEHVAGGCLYYPG